MSVLLPVLRDQGFDRGGLQTVVLFFVVRNFGEPFPPEHPGDKWMMRRQIERALDAARLDLRGVFSPGFESPWLGRGARAFVVADFDKKKLLAILFRKFFQLGAARFPAGRNFRRARVGGRGERKIGED